MPDTPAAVPCQAEDGPLYGRKLGCLCAPDRGALPVHAVTVDELEGWLGELAPAQAAFIRASGFAAKRGAVALIPGESGLSGAVLGLGTPALRAGAEFEAFGGLAGQLPDGTTWRLGGGIQHVPEAVLSFCLGAYRFDVFRSAARPPGAVLALPGTDGLDECLAAAETTWLVRDLVNTPANRLGPQELARAAVAILGRNGERNRVQLNVITGDAMRAAYPAVAAVADGSIRPGAVVVMRWRGSAAAEDAALISICGKGVCFDTGGYDLKSADGMLRMKKDMAGAAVAIGLSRMVMDADLPCRLELRIACVENAVSGHAMRPLDVLQTRSGLTVEVGNTDAEGRLVLCDLLAEASEQAPRILLDFATLTGAARSALGPDLPAMFCNDDGLASMFAQAGVDEHDSVWRLPLWNSYNFWLESGVADLNNVSGKAHAGAIVAALFLQRFVGRGIAWAHFDLYGWNDQASPGRSAGGEAQGLRAAYRAISRFIHNPERMFSGDITPIDETLELSLR